MDIGWTAVTAALSELAPDATISDICETIAQAFLTAVGASSGPLYAGAFQSAGAAVSDRLNLDGPAMAAWIGGMGNDILARGGAKPGDKTMLDAWVPAATAARAAADEGADEKAVLKTATRAARTGMDHTAEARAKLTYYPLLCIGEEQGNGRNGPCLRHPVRRWRDGDFCVSRNRMRSISTASRETLRCPPAPGL